MTSKIRGYEEWLMPNKRRPIGRLDAFSYGIIYGAILGLLIGLFIFDLALDQALSTKNNPAQLVITEGGEVCYE